MANIKLKNGWNEEQVYSNVASVTFPTDVEGVMATYYENGSGGSGGLSAQADWNENNPNQASYIKNRPFYVYYEPIYQSNLVQFTINSISNLYEAVIRIPQPIVENKSYVVYWHDTGFLCTATKINNEIYLGDLSLIDASYAQDDPEPFVAFYDNTTNSIVFSTSSKEAYHIVGLFDGEEQIQKLDKKFLPSDIAAEADWSATEGQPGFINNKPDLTVYAEKAVIAETLKNYETIKSAEARIENVTKSFNETLKNYETTQAVNEKVETLNQEIAKRATKEEVEQAFQDTQADWSIEDESNLASIRNKPFGDIPDLLSNTELTFVLNEETGAYEAETGLILEPGINYVVTWNEEEFLCQVEEEDNGHFILTEQGIFITSNPIENPIVTLRKEDNVYRVDKKYLPIDEILDGIASEDYVGEQIKAIPQANWTQKNEKEPDFIRNKPTIPSIAGLASEEYVKQAVADSRADWESIDIGNNRYIANKPFGTMPLYFSEEKEYNFTYISYGDISRSEETVKGLYSTTGDQIYVFYFDGTRYELKEQAYSISDDYIIHCFGNPYLVGKYYKKLLPDNNLPFGCGVNDFFYIRGNPKKHRIAYYSLETEEKLLDAKWLPPTVASTTYVNDYVNSKIAEAAGIQSDWNSTDVSSTSFIKNKPFGYVQNLLTNCNFVCQQGAATVGNLCFYTNFNIKFKAEETYIVTWDNIEYELVAYETSFTFPGGIGFSKAVFLGNQKIITEAGANSEQPPYESSVPFYMGNGFVFMKNNSQNLTTQHTLSIRLKNNYQKIKLSDLPDEVININPDWNQEDPTAPDYIKNKPTIPSLPVYSEEAFTNYKGMHLVYTGEKWDGIRPDAPDWQVTNNLDSRYIHNKPFGEVGEILRIEEFVEGPMIIRNHTAHFYGDTAPVYFDIGKTYQINITGQIYTSVCQELDRGDLDFAVYFGNGKIASDILSQVPTNGVVDTGENYAIIVLISDKGTSDQSTTIALLQRGNYPKQTLSISSTETKKIDKKFLPDECFNSAVDEKRISTLEKLVEAQANLISQMQQQLQDLTQRVERLEQGYTPPSGPGASVNGDTLEIEGNVADEILTIQGGTVSNETLALSGGSGTQATVDGEELTINGLIANEVLNLGSGTVVGETLGLTGDVNAVIEETVSTTGIINDDILSSSGVVTADETWEVN